LIFERIPESLDEFRPLAELLQVNLVKQWM
jgi:hypothetical protein